ncbi:Ribonuclease 1 [Citrus sinensis]|uniref:Ribonuclease 1 n=1 Tax=Citrus sinensis TaxID=2711 RepID=A0ACB8KEE4_CITSI|nr:Ribonuclease 1 [Citrus sinensis]
MKIKASCLFLLALLATTCDSSGFDHFWLVQVWPSGYCLQANCSQTSDRFIIHGLWAVNVVDKTLPGTAGKGDPSIRPSWKKHGSAAKEFIQPRDYFQMALQLAKDTDLRNTLQNHGAVPILPDGGSYNKRDYKAAIKNKTGHDPLLKCVKGDDGISHLKEVIICVDDQAQSFIQCAKQKDRCYFDIMFDVPPRTN